MRNLVCVSKIDKCVSACERMYRVGQNRTYTPYTTVYLVISLQKIPYMHRRYMVLANPTYVFVVFMLRVLFWRAEPGGAACRLCIAVRMCVWCGRVFVFVFVCVVLFLGCGCTKL